MIVKVTFNVIMYLPIPLKKKKKRKTRVLLYKE